MNEIEKHIIRKWSALVSGGVTDRDEIAVEIALDLEHRGIFRTFEEILSGLDSLYERGQLG